jgi:hypothetical protein
MSELEFSWDQKCMFWVSRRKQLIFAFRITNNKIKFLVLQNFSLSSLLWGVAIYLSHALKECEGVYKIYITNSDCTLINTSSWEIKIFLPLVIVGGWNSMGFYYERLCWLFYSCYITYENKSLCPLSKLHNCCLLRWDGSQVSKLLLHASNVALPT